MKLPIEFETRMKAMLGDEWESFEKAFQSEPPGRALRVNTLKEDAEKAIVAKNGKSEALQWCKNAYLEGNGVLSGKHPYHMAGLFYYQEPSATAVAESIDICEGDYVLDLCAAPGGKATQAAAKLNGKGLLVANEIIPKRASILSENIERMGIKNAVVTCEHPERLCEFFKDFFDKIIVDAPCSGEGMFRKEPQAVEQWSQEHTQACALRQKKIIDSAVRMLTAGGYLIYSTCTFAPCENEGVCEYIIENYPEMELCDITTEGLDDAKGEYISSKYDFSGAKRIFPHHSKGEGHFLALFQKKTGNERAFTEKRYSPKPKEYAEFEKSFLNCSLSGEFVYFGDKLYLLPIGIDIDKLKVLRAGLLLGERKKNRFEPSHALALALRREDFKSICDLACSDSRLLAFLSGESIEFDGKGWTAVLADGYPIGWGKASDGVLKNHIPKSLRVK